MSLQPSRQPRGQSSAQRAVHTLEQAEELFAGSCLPRTRNWHDLRARFRFLESDFFCDTAFTFEPHLPNTSMSSAMRSLGASIALRPACLRGKARYAVHRLAVQPTAAARSFTSTRFLGSSAGEGTFEDIKVEPYIETRGAKVAHHGECLFCATSRGAAAHGQLTRIRARRQAPADDSKV